jgi:alpha-methylacyl-CoA racemase
LSDELAKVFKQKTREQWCDIMEGTDICFAPVLDYTEAPEHPHNKARESYIKIDGVTQPAPAPKFANYSLDTPEAPQTEGQDTESVLTELGYSEEEILSLKQGGAIPMS